MTQRNNRKEIAEDTLKIMEQGYYHNAQGEKVAISHLVNECVDNTICYTPWAQDELLEQVKGLERPNETTNISIANETTLEGIFWLQDNSDCQRVAALNFASAKNPGGGFLGGAQAQEEALARSSALYASLVTCEEYYKHNRWLKTCFYSDYANYSPRCPIFRDDSGELLDYPVLVDFITSPAPNAGVIKEREPHRVDEIQPVLYQRAAKVLSIAAKNACDGLVLGAWGCGVFRNNPEMVAAVFESLLNQDYFVGRFKHIRFSVLDRSGGKTFPAFERMIHC